MAEERIYINVLPKDARIVSVNDKGGCYEISVRNSDEKFTIAKSKLGSTPPPQAGDKIALFQHLEKKYKGIIAGIELRGQVLFMYSEEDLDGFLARAKKRLE